MCISLGIDQLSVDADPIARSPDAPLQQITDAELAAHLLRIDGLVPVRERGISRDDQHVLKPRQISRQILGDAVREILLLPVGLSDGDGCRRGIRPGFYWRLRYNFRSPLENGNPPLVAG